VRLGTNADNLSPGPERYLDVVRTPTRLGMALAVVLAVTTAGCTEAPSAGTGSPAASSDGASDDGSVRSSPTGTPDSPTPTDDPALPAYSSSVQRLTPALRDRMGTSHRAGCPVPWERLRYLRLGYVDFEGTAQTGELVVRADLAEDVTRVFATLYGARFPIERMVLVDEYGGDDDASMAVNNTSAYNCRNVAGTDRWSNHAFGAAIDINPIQNPYVQGDSVSPPSGRRYADIDRSAGAQAPPGVIVAGDVVVRAFAVIGWEWGGDWASSKDYQHFSAGGG